MEYLSDRFGPMTHQVFSWATIVFQLFTSAAMLYGLSLFVSTACQFSVTATVLLTGGVILFYSVLGGIWAVVVPDFLQAGPTSAMLYQHAKVGIPNFRQPSGSGRTRGHHG